MDVHVKRKRAIKALAIIEMADLSDQEIQDRLNAAIAKSGRDLNVVIDYVDEGDVDGLMHVARTIAAT